MNHTARRVLALVALLTLVLTGCARTAPPGSQDDGPATATIGLTYIPDIQFAPFYVAAEEASSPSRGWTRRCATTAPRRACSPRWSPGRSST